MRLLSTFASGVTQSLLAYMEMSPEQQAIARMYIRRKIKAVPLKH